MPEIPAEAVRAARARRSLLWVCQRYDLEPQFEPHSLAISAAEAALRYRQTPSADDVALAALYWEGVWLEGARSPLLTALRGREIAPGAKADRNVVVLAGEADVAAVVAAEEFLPVVVLPGVIDDQAPPDTRYGELPTRRRERVAYSLAARIETLPRRALFVVGANEQADLALLGEYLEDLRITDLDVVLVWPAEEPLPKLAGGPGVHLHVWHGSPGALADELQTIGAPKAGDVALWSVRVGKRAIELTPTDVHRIVKRFALVTERDLRTPDRLDIEDVLALLDGRIDNWRAMAAGVAVERAYRSDSGESLAGEVLRAAEEIGRDDAHRLTVTIELPVESGSGATTLLRQAAHEVAAAGYPTLVMRPDQVELDLEELRAFFLALTTQAAAAGVRGRTPFLLVFDIEHLQFTQRLPIAQALASHGRNAVILQAVPAAAEHAGRRRLPVLRAAAASGEVEACEVTFRTARERWQLPLEVPSLDRWRDYDRATQWRSPDRSSSAANSLFWVALRFFLTAGLDLSIADRAEESLGRWVARRAGAIESARMRDFVRYVAALSAQRIVSPLWTVLRPITGSTFSSDVTSTLRTLDGVVEWLDYSDELDDQVLRFMHAALADVYLRAEGIASLPDQVELLRPVLSALTQKPSDMWVAESVTTAIFPPRGEFNVADWNWVVDTVASLPPLVRDNSKVILHQWGRALYQSADPRARDELAVEERERRLREAVARLERAVEIPRRPGRDETQSNLLNSLGTAYARLAHFLRDVTQETEPEAEAWGHAAEAFDRSIRLSGGLNMDPLLAFSHRLIEHANAVKAADRSAALRDVVQAHSTLDDAEDLEVQAEDPDPEWRESIENYRRRAHSVLDDEEGRRFVEELKRGPDRELGIVLEARSLLEGPSGQQDLDAAIGVLEGAEDDGERLGPRADELLVRLLQRHPRRRYEFGRLFYLYRRLETSGWRSKSMVDEFRHAVVCYQAGELALGAELFRKLRERGRQSSSAPLRLHDFWRDDADPDSPRSTYVRIDRILGDWRADGFVQELRQSVPLRPRHFNPAPKVGEVVPCGIQFETSGPLAVPMRFLARRAVS